MSYPKLLRVDTGPIRSIQYRALHLIFDLGALSAAWYLTGEIRLLLNPYMSIVIAPQDMNSVAPRLSALLLLWILAALWRKIYRTPQDPSLVAGLLRVAESATLVSSLLIILTFFSRQLGAGLSRSFVLLFAPVSFVLLALSYLSVSAAAREMERRWPDHKRIAILGAGRLAQDVIKAIRRSTDPGASLCGLILPASAAATGGATFPLPVLGTTHELAEVINRESLDRIIVACDTLTEPEADYCGEVTRRMGVVVTQPLRTRDAQLQVRYQNEYGLHLIDLEAPPSTQWRDLLKRSSDMVLSLGLITMLAPLILFIAVVIRMTSDGPVLYRSRRVGRGGRHFIFWKFRTMYVRGPSRGELAQANERSGHLFKMRRDPRVTPVGRVLRRLSLDELPQLFNVLAGDMSLVGPRPLPAEDLDPDGMSREFAKWARERSHVRPGITGLWQVRGRSEVPFDQMVELDLEYVRNWSLRVDLSILLITPIVVLSGRGAY
ncbi:MAG TPA: sugar transferase [Bryobacteraceae bacterium]|nr:sugar transferase [Bryobacteraceae bacterium]